MSRFLDTHIIKGDVPENQLTIEVLDEPGQGGACHEYEILHGEDFGTYLEFQNGPIKEYGVNGVTEAALLAILIDRLEAFQNGPYKSEVNSNILDSFKSALYWTQYRTRERIQRQVEGTSAK